MWTIEFLVYLELILNLILLGLIAVIQFVHYPLFERVPESGRYDYHQAHMRAITPLVLPLMVLELVLLIFLSIQSPSLLVLVRLSLLGLVWISTFFLQVPLHEKIAQNPQTNDLVNRLVMTNWVRTLAWLIKAFLGSIYFWGITNG